MLSLSKLNQIVLQPKEIAVIDEDIVIIDEISDEDLRSAEPEITESLFPFKNRQEIIDEAARLGKFFKDRSIPDVYISGIKNLRSFVDSAFEKMRSYYHDDLYLKDRVIDLQSIERRVK